MVQISGIFKDAIEKWGLEIDEETLEWYSMSPAERFEESQKLWNEFLALGGKYDPEPDSQSPFYIFEI